MDANDSNLSSSTDSDNSDVNNPSSSSTSGDTLIITKTKSVKSAVWKYFGYKDEAAMKEETAVC